MLGFIVFNLIGLLTALICIFFTFYKWSHGYWARKNVPYFKPYIPWGTGRKFREKVTKSPGHQMTEMYTEASAKGWKFYGVYNFWSPTFVPVDLELLKNILSKDFSHFMDRGIYFNEKDDPLGAHLFALGGNKWRNLRRKLSPTFTSGKMKYMFKIVADCGEIFAREVEKRCSSPVDIKEMLAKFTTDVIGSCAFGLECKSFEEEETAFRWHSKNLFNFEGKKWKPLLIGIAMNYPAFGRAIGLKLLNEESAQFFFDVCRDTIDYRQKNNVVKRDFFQLLMDIKSENDAESSGDGNTLTLNEIAAQCHLFFVAGFETSSSAMTYALFEMSRNKELQEKVREEVLRVLEKYKGEVTYEALMEMTYMNQVLDEVLRLYPPVTMVTRCCTEDYTIPGTDVVIEKGTRVVVPIMGIHHDPKNYPNPQVFDPERFSPENKRKRDQYAHIPFGEGNRICIGMRFGIMQAKMGLTVLLKNFEFTLNEKTKVPLQFTNHSILLGVVGGIWLNCTPLKVKETL